MVKIKKVKKNTNKVVKIKSKKNVAKKPGNLTIHDFARNLADREFGIADLARKYRELFSSMEATVMNGNLNPGDKITLPGIGHLFIVERKARKGRNPKTGESLEIPSRVAVKFKLTGPMRLYGKPKAVKNDAEDAPKKGKKIKKVKKVKKTKE